MSVVNIKSTLSKIDAFNATTNAKSLGKDCTKPIELVGIIIQPGPEMTDQHSGEVHPTTQTFLLDKTGTSWQSLADGIARAAELICEQFGEADGWPEGLKVELVKGSASNGNQVRTLRLSA